MKNERGERRDIPASDPPPVAERSLASFLLNDANQVVVGAVGGVVGSALTIGASKVFGKHDSGNGSGSPPPKDGEGRAPA